MFHVKRAIEIKRGSRQVDNGVSCAALSISSLYTILYYLEEKEFLWTQKS